MPVDDRRQKTLYGLSAARGTVHRYTIARWIVGVLFTAGIAALPFLDVLRFDFWAGRHRLLGEPATFLVVARAFAWPFLAVNVLILLVSRFLGRWLCGFVCPVGALNRLAEWFRWRHRKSRTGVVGTTLVLAVCALLGAIVFGFWVDWAVFARGSTTAKIAAGAFFAGVTLSLFALVELLGMRFCRDFCPSGVYFALLGPRTLTGIGFANPQNCTDCHACERVCPVDLEPRRMSAGEPRGSRGFYPDGLSNFANCLRCGDCVVACEETTDPVDTPLRMGLLQREERGS